MTDVNTLVTVAAVQHELTGGQAPQSTGVFLLGDTAVYMMCNTKDYITVFAMSDKGDLIWAGELNTPIDCTEYASFLIENGIDIGDMHGTYKNWLKIETYDPEDFSFSGDGSSYDYESSNTESPAEESSSAVSDIISRTSDWSNYSYNSTVSNKLEENGMGMSDSIKVARIIGAAINDGAVKLSSLEVTDSSLFTVKMETHI